MDRPVQRLTPILAAACTALAVAGCGQAGAAPGSGPSAAVRQSGVTHGRTAAPLLPPVPSLPPGPRVTLTAASNHSSVTVRPGDIVVLRLAGSPSSPWMTAGDSMPGQLVQEAVKHSASGGLVQVFQARADTVAELAARRGASCGTGDASCDPFTDPAFSVTLKVTG